MLTVSEVRGILESKNFLAGNEFLYGCMYSNLGLERGFEYYNVYKKGYYSMGDIEKIYNYFTETQYYVNQIDSQYVTYGDRTTFFLNENTILEVNREDSKVIKYIEDVYKLQNKFVEKEYVDIEDKKKSKKNYIFGIGVIAVIGYLVFK